MISIKVMKQGEPWIGEIRCPVVPRVDEIVELGNKQSYYVLRVMYEWGADESSKPFIVLNPTPV